MHFCGLSRESGLETMKTEKIWKGSRLVAGLCLLFAIGAHAQDEAPPDQSAELQQQLEAAGGDLKLAAGTYYLDTPITFDLAKLGAVSLRGDGPVTVVMRGAGPAFRFLGTHEGTASPKSFKPETWAQRMPLIDGIAIVGDHPEAVGIELKGTVQATVTRVSVRKALHGVHLVDRNRNTLIADCHFYENAGKGVFLDDVNLHQINITGSHISYNREGGVVVIDGNVRNLHITGCDIEANMPGDETPTDTANVLIVQTGAEKRSIAEVAITGCTIQHSAHYGKGKIADGGANIRLVGTDEHLVNMVTISGNVLSDTTTHIDLHKVMDVTVTGNTFFTTEPTDLQITDSKRVVVQGNAFNPRQEKSIGGVVLRRSSHCLLDGLTLHAIQADEGAILLEECSYSRISNCILSDNKKGIVLKDSVGCVVRGVTTTGLPKEVKPVEVVGGKQNSVEDIVTFPVTDTNES